MARFRRRRSRTAGTNFISPAATAPPGPRSARARMGSGWHNVDEWGRAGQLQQFFAGPELQAFTATTGARPEPPQIIVAEALTVTQF